MNCFKLLRPESFITTFKDKEKYQEYYNQRMNKVKSNINKILVVGILYFLIDFLIQRNLISLRNLALRLIFLYIHEKGGSYRRYLYFFM